jgi:glutathione S-transferase
MAQKTRGKYVFGDKITAADIFFYPQVIAATTRFGANIKDYKNSE